MLGGLLTSAEREHVTEGLQQPADPGTEERTNEAPSEIYSKKGGEMGQNLLFNFVGLF